MSAVRHIAFIVLPGFAVTSFALAHEAFSVANQVIGSDYYQSHICTPETDTLVYSSNSVGMSATSGLSVCEQADWIVLCAYKYAADYRDTGLTQVLQRARYQGKWLASLSSGAFVFARAGLLKGQRCVVHDFDRVLFSEYFPQIKVQHTLYTVDHPIYTSLGGTAALDLMLYWLARDQGADFALQVNDAFIRARVRAQDEGRQLTYRLRSDHLGAAVELMMSHLESPLPIAVIADKIGVSVRTLELLFQKQEQHSPNVFYRNLRLQEAHNLLHQSALSVQHIALTTGFKSVSYFGKCYKARYGLTPTAARIAQNL